MSAEHWDLDQDNTLGGNNPSPNKVSSQKALKEYIDSQGGGSSIDVQINGASIVSNDVANILTNSAYSSNNKIATMSDVKQDVFIGTKGTTTFQQFKDAYDAGMMLYALEPDDTYGIYTFKRYYTTSSKNIFEFTRTYSYSTGIRTEVWTFSSSGDNYSDSTIIREQVQSNWNETNTNSKAYIQNKPTIPTVPTNVSAFNNDAGYTSNIGTVTSVNNVQPVNGNVTLSIPDTSTFEKVSNKVISISSSSTDAQYPSAKCVYDVINTVKRNIGEIVQSTIPLSDAGLHLLDGALLQYGSYKDFIDYIASIYNASANYFCSESDWQTSVTNYGVCGKFVYDSTNNTVRLPKITGFIKGTDSNSSIGNLTEAGLPNITGSTSGWTIKAERKTIVDDGAIYTNKANAGWAKTESQNATNLYGIYFDASLSNSIYGNSTTVQPQSVKVLYYIVIANSTKTEIEVDIDNIATDLNGKADTNLSNVPTSKGILTESYVSGTSWYRVYADGWCEQGGRVIRSDTRGTVTMLKTFSNTSYTLICQEGETTTYEASGSDTGGYADNMGVTNGTVNSFRYSIVSNRHFQWRACGYIR